MTDHLKDERAVGQPEPFLKNATNNTVDFSTARDHCKHLVDDKIEGLGKCQMLKELQRRSACFDSGIFPLHGDNLLVSLPGGFSFVVPDLRAAHRLLRRWETRA